MAYVYRHIRLDKNQPFYIGIGSDDKYYRAEKKQSRNKWWHNIVNKAGYDIEIMIDGISWEEAQRKEIEFIALYGRKENGGILVNLTDGGGGAIGLIVSKETRLKQSLKKKGKPPSNKGKPMPKHQLEALVASNKGRTPWNKGVSPRPESVEKFKAKMKGRVSSFKGHTWSEAQRKAMSEQRKGMPPPNKGIKMSEEFILKNKLSKINRGVLQYNIKGDFIKEFYSLKDAADSVGCKKQSIAIAIKEKTKNGADKTAMGYRWKYKK